MTEVTSATEFYILGHMYEQGTRVKRDYSEAAYWFHKSADLGYADAQFKLGWLYANGLGVEQDYEQADIWYKKANRI